MKVLHIIPSAFNYFDDIRSDAFKIVEAEGQYGVEADAITLEYGALTKSEKTEIKISAPDKKYIGQETIEKNSELWSEFDIVNLHCPFLGGAKKILDWADKNSDKSLVLTYHHDFETTDFFSWFIKIYNYYYLPRIFKKAKLVTFFFDHYDSSKIGLKMFKNNEKILILGVPQEGQDVHSDQVVQDLIIVYNSLVNLEV